MTSQVKENYSNRSPLVSIFKFTWAFVISQYPSFVTFSYFRLRLQNRLMDFLFLSSNIPSSPAYGVFISAHTVCQGLLLCFILRAARLSSKLLGQGYVRERLKSSLRKFYCRYGDLIKHYEAPLSQMLHDILGHDHIQWHPQLSQTLHQFANCTSMYRHIYNWNIVACDVKQPISLTHSNHSKSS